MKYVELNRPAIWHQIRNEETSVRVYNGGYPYMSNGIVLMSTELNPVIRYAKNFTKYRKTFSMFIFSDEKDQGKIEDFLAKQVKTLTKEDVVAASSADFVADYKYLSITYEGAK